MAKDFAPSKNLVPVHSVVPEQKKGEGAILILRDGSFRMILRTGAVNFDMKSPNERSALTFGFGSLVNSLEVGFPIQIVSHSKILDVENYIRQFDSRLANRNTPEAIRQMIESHLAHFRAQVQQNNILQREHFIVIPWKGVAGTKKSTIDEVPFAGFLKSIASDIEERKLLEHKPTDLDIATARQQLDIRSHQVIARLQAMQIWARRLNEEDVRKLLYGLFHPGLSERQRDPGLDTGGSLVAGFSSEGLPRPQRRIGSDQPLTGGQS